MDNQLRLKITQLLDKHQDPDKPCKGCNICDQIAVLREQLNVPPQIKYKHILDKGKNMTEKEKKFLQHKGMRIADINKYIKLLEAAASPNKPKVEFPLIQHWDEFVKLKAQGKMDKEIAVMWGVSVSSICKMKKDKKEEKEKGLILTPEETMKLKADLAASQKREAELMERNNVLTEQLQKSKRDYELSQQNVKRLTEKMKRMKKKVSNLTKSFGEAL